MKSTIEQKRCNQGKNLTVVDLESLEFLGKDSHREDRVFAFSLKKKKSIKTM